VTQVVRAAGAGVLVGSPREFVDAVVRLAEDEAGRRALAETAAVQGRSLDWRALAQRYNEILDRYIPR
jgi:glycosyltransferase involved in cell wall biosynthesis